jgi:hypothetical protein
MKVLILGGDGYLGWPTAMHLTAKGHIVAVVDNYLRRRLSREENVEPLFEVPNLYERARLWEKITGYQIKVFIGDLARWNFMAEVFTGSGREKEIAGISGGPRNAISARMSPSGRCVWSGRGWPTPAPRIYIPMPAIQSQTGKNLFPNDPDFS